MENSASLTNGNSLVAATLERAECTSDAFPLDGNGDLCRSLRRAWGVSATWKELPQPKGWYKAAVEHRLSAMSKLTVASALLTTLAGSAISSPMASDKGFPGHLWQKIGFHTFIILLAIAFVCLLGCTLFLSMVMWNVEKEFSADAYVDALGTLPTFEVGYGAWRRIVKLGNFHLYPFCWHVNVMHLSSWLFMIGCFCLLGAFGIKVFCSTDDIEAVKIVVACIFGFGTFVIAWITFHTMFEVKAVRRRPGLDIKAHTDGHVL